MDSEPTEAWENFFRTYPNTIPRWMDTASEDDLQRILLQEIESHHDIGDSFLANAVLYVLITPLQQKLGERWRFSYERLLEYQLRFCKERDVMGTLLSLERAIIGNSPLRTKDWVDKYEREVIRGAITKLQASEYSGHFGFDFPIGYDGIHELAKNKPTVLISLQQIMQSKRKLLEEIFDAANISLNQIQDLELLKKIEELRNQAILLPPQNLLEEIVRTFLNNDLNQPNQQLIKELKTKLIAYGDPCCTSCFTIYSNDGRIGLFVGPSSNQEIKRRFRQLQFEDYFRYVDNLSLEKKNLLVIPSPDAPPEIRPYLHRKPLKLKDGIKEIFDLVNKVIKRPVVIGIYGHTNAGKTYLLEQCIEEAKRQLYSVAGGPVDKEDSYSLPNRKYLHELPDLIFVMGYIIPDRTTPERYVKKPIDVTVLIYNDKICHPKEFEYINYYRDRNKYDIIIENPNPRIRHNEMIKPFLTIG